MIKTIHFSLIFSNIISIRINWIKNIIVTPQQLIMLWSLTIITNLVVSKISLKSRGLVVLWMNHSRIQKKKKNTSYIDQQVKYY